MNRVEIIEEIKEMAKFHDLALASAALEVVRYPDDEMIMDKAQKLLLRSAERVSMSKQVSHLINRGWPEDIKERE